MWAGCIWVPIYEVMTRKRLTMVTLEENLEMAADIGIDATTSLEAAFAQAMERQGPDAKVIVLPFARYQLPRNAIRMSSEEVTVLEEVGCRTYRPILWAMATARRGRGSRLDDDRRVSPPLPER